MTLDDLRADAETAAREYWLAKVAGHWADAARWSGIQRRATASYHAARDAAKLAAWAAMPVRPCAAPGCDDHAAAGSALCVLCGETPDGEVPF